MTQTIDQQPDPFLHRSIQESDIFKQLLFTEALLRFAKKLEQAQTYREALAAVQAELQISLGLQSVWVYVLSDDQKFAEVLTLLGPIEERVLDNQSLTRLSIENDPFLRDLIQSRELVYVEDAQSDSRVDKAIVQNLGNRTLVNVPLLANERQVGILGTGTFGDEGVRPFSEAEQSFLAVLASHLGITLERIRLVFELGRREQKEAQQLHYALALNQLNDAILQLNQANLIFEVLARIIGETLEVDLSTVYDVSYTQEALVKISEWVNPTVNILKLGERYLIENFSNSVFEIERTRNFLTSYADEVNPFLEMDGAADCIHVKSEFQSCLWFPFGFYVGGYHLIGLYQGTHRRSWTNLEIEFLDAVSRQVSIAAEKIRMVEDRKRVEEEFQWNFNLQMAVTKLLRLSLDNLTLDQILQRAIEVVVTIPWLLIEPYGAIFLLDESSQTLKLNAQFNLPASAQRICNSIRLGECYCGKGAFNREVVYINRSAHPDISEPETKQVYGNYCVPITWEDQTLGVINLYLKAGQTRVEHDQAFLLTIADVLVGIIQRKKMEEKILEGEAKYRSLVEQLPLVVYTAYLGINGAWIYVSPQIEGMLGFTQEEWLADPEIWYRQIYPDDQVRQQTVEEDCALYGGTFDSDYRMFTRDGREIWVRDTGLIIQPLDGGMPIVQGVFMDVSERKMAEMEVARYAKNTAAMYELSQIIHTNTNLDEVSIETHRAVEKMMPCDAFAITLLDDPSKEVIDVYLWDHGQRWPGGRFPFGGGLTGYIGYTRRPLRVNDWNDTHNQLIQAYEFGDPGKDDTHSVLAVPLVRSGGGFLGMISVQAYARNAYNPEHEQVLVTLANQVSKTIDSVLLISELQHSNSELSIAYEATIEGWSRAMDLRDKETEGHTERVTEMALRLALAMGMDETSRLHLRRGGLLHDIGKLGVPDEILYKQENLNGTEWEIMRQHPQFAFEMLSQIPYLSSALDIPFCHHEKWDGTGYPRGLKGEEIPLSARIFAVVDVWDALHSDRPYRKGWSAAKIRSYIREQQGKHFDPRVVDVFLELTSGL